jgi:hypothetical protein
MRTGRQISFVVVVVVLAVLAGVGLWLTRAGQPTGGKQSRRTSVYANRVDQQPLVTAQQLDRLTTTREEARYSQQSVNVADHEVDLAFTSALRQAQAHPTAPTPETKAIRERIKECENRVAADEDEITKLSDVNKPSDAQVQELQLAEAEFVLHRNELDDAKRDLARSGANPEVWIQRQFQQHQAAMHPAQAQAAAVYIPKPPFAVPHTLYAQLRQWFDLRSKRQQLAAAQQQALSLAVGLSAQHDQLEKQLNAPPVLPATAAADARASIKAVERRSDDQKTLSEYDQRIQDLQELSQTYADWDGVVSAQMTASLHGALNSMLGVLLVLFLLLLAMSGVDRLTHRVGGDRRRAATTRLLGRVFVQGLALIVIVFIIIGPPNQLSTILALAGAGLTVALKDFIVAFFGWFVLMGKNGVRIGDWVEINGIIGEVIEIGLLRTTLLETGNWAESGHPTGRRVTFVNSFAIEGHYFNFSTSGQWLWDTLEIMVPPGVDPQTMMDPLLELVRKETEATGRLAEQEWKHAARSGGMRAFSADPTVELRPAATGFMLVVHYISSAGLRFETRGRLYHRAFALLHPPADALSTAAPKG